MPAKTTKTPVKKPVKKAAPAKKAATPPLKVAKPKKVPAPKAEVAVTVPQEQIKTVLSTTHKIKPLHPRTLDTKYTGFEPTWTKQPDPTSRAARVLEAFNWYNYHYDKKIAKELIIDWLHRSSRNTEAKVFAKIPESDVKQPIGWLCRMHVMGFELTDKEEKSIIQHITDLCNAVSTTKETVKDDAAVGTKPNIQDRLREKMQEAAAELEGMLDDFTKSGAKITAEFKPITVIRTLNVAPQLVGEIVQIWQRRLDELTLAVAGKDAQLVEGYSNFGKIQLRNLVKFAELVIADCGSYVQIKKTERKPRAKKPVSPEKLTSKFKYMREFADLKLKSVSVTDLVGAQEAWLYETRKRKLIHVVADTHVGSFTVKGAAIIGFDTTNSTQKTLRKPADQLKALMAASVPQARKVFKDIKATEVKWNGRSNENLVLLKVR